MKNFKKISREGLKNIVGGIRNPYEAEDQITMCYSLLYCLADEKLFLSKHILPYYFS
ncbi:bacteriocin-like protein [Chryseobacterium daeguense]|uniref:bacteriocin-like protein n=1 Tax=Chryseobacterium daeguense TaxID=412438 RepID=UPI00041093F2